MARFGPAPQESGLGAALAVGVRPRGAGVRVRLLVVPLDLRRAFLPYSPVGGAEARQQALVVEAAALLAKRVLGEIIHTPLGPKIKAHILPVKSVDSRVKLELPTMHCSTFLPDTDPPAYVF